MLKTRGQQIMQCILCQNSVDVFKNIKDREYFKCSSCHSIMLNPKNYPCSEKEKQRYEEHKNDVNNKGYQAFVLPIVEAVLKDYGKHHKGLDFGSGTGPVITKLLRDDGYDIDIYDPFFANNKEKLEETYDYIVCCEVMEHFHYPIVELTRLKAMLKPGGSLYLKTKIYNEEIDFDLWYYKDDQTHVFFYHKTALEYIEKQYGFSEMTIVKDMIIYRTK
jgi:SAM-dependent methyltransferase